jgi:hypothetical protein
MQNQRMPKQIVAGTTEGKRKRKRPRKRWRDEVEEGLNMTKKGRQWSETVLSAGRVYWKPRSTRACSAR